MTPGRVVRAKVIGNRFAKTQYYGGAGAETLVEVRGRFRGSIVDGTVLYIRNYSAPTPSPDCSTQGRFDWRAHRV